MPADLAAVLDEGERLLRENEGKHKHCTMDPGPHEALKLLPRLLRLARRGAEAEPVIRRIVENHDARLADRGILVYDQPFSDTGFVPAIHWLAAWDAAASGAGEKEKP